MAKGPTLFDLHATGMIDLEAAAPTKVGNGRYLMRKMLGRGGMGIVWLAHDERLNRDVALKFLPSQIRYDAAALDDLKRETARSQVLSHPNIVRIHDLYEAAGEDPFISMEYVDGSNLASLRVEKPERVLSWAFLERLVLQLCEALEYAHGEGIVHRDLKPANLMVDGAGRLKLADFGIARAVTDTMTRISVSQTSGTLLYMSPQQLEGGQPKRTDDTYGLGACLYELLTSKPPFHTGDLLHQLRNQSPKPLAERLREFGLKNDIPAYVNDLVLACLEKDERRRPQTAGEVQEWLSRRRVPRRFAAKPISLDRLRMAREALQWTKRWPWYAVGACVVALGLFAGLSMRPEDTVVARTATGSASSVTIADPAVDSTQVVLANDRRTSARPSKPPTPLVARAVQRTNTQSTVVTGSLLVAKSDGSVAPLSPEKSNLPTLRALVAKGNTHVPEHSKNKLIRAISSRSPVTSPPQRWRLVYHDADASYGVVELRFEKGLMAQLHEPSGVFEIFGPQASNPIGVETINTDSDEAVHIALGLPSAARLGVDSFELELERGSGGMPVWKVRLFVVQDNTEKSVGTVVIAAENGKVMRDISKR